MTDPPPPSSSHRTSGETKCVIATVSFLPPQAYRIGANRRAFGGQQVKLRAIDDAIAENAEDGGGGGAPPLISELQFQAPLYRTRENADHATLVVTRSAPLDAPCRQVTRYFVFPAPACPVGDIMISVARRSV